MLSRERLLVFWGEMGLGGLLRLELLEAVECLGESESCKTNSIGEKQRNRDQSLPQASPVPTTQPPTGVSRRPLHEMIGGCTHMKIAEPFIKKRLEA